MKDYWVWHRRFLAAVLYSVALLTATHASAQRYSFRIYGQQDGLKNLNVVCMLKDREGYLWLGTDNGLFRYDGARFVEYNTSAGLTNPYVSALAEDSSGNLWAGTANGLFVLKGQSFQELRFNGQSLSIGLDSALASLPDSRLLAVSRSRLFEIMPAPSEPKGWTVEPLAGTGDFRQLSSAENVVSVYVDDELRIWFGCNDALCSMAGGKLTRWGVERGVPESSWMAIFEDHKGTLWARSTRNVIALGNGKMLFQSRSAGQESELADNHYISFGETQAGEIITPGAEGIALWTRNHWKYYPVAEGLNTYAVESIYVDPDGLIWSGIEGHGLCRWLRYSAWENWTTADGLESPIVWGIVLDDNGRIWAADDKGVSVSDPERTHFSSALEHLSTESIIGITEDPKGHIWAVSGTGVLWKFDDDLTLRPRRIAKTTDANEIYADPYGKIWISTEEGLYVCDSSACSPHKVTLAALDSGNVYRVVAAPDGTLWAGGDYGIFYNSGGDWHPVASSLTGPEARLIGQVTDMDLAADGSLWIVNGFSRVVKLKVAKGRILSAHVLGPDDISSTSTLFVRSDHRGYIWVGHDRGVDVFDGHSWHLITANQGLLWNDTDANAFTAGGDDTVWIGTSEGISHYTGAPFELTPELPTPQVSRISYGGDPVRPGGKLLWKQAALELLFSPFAYQQEDQISYEYRLDGIDRDWQRSDSPETRYPALLRPGDYTFQLRTVSQVSNAVSPLTTVRFTIVPNWWQTDWFKLLCVIGGVSLLMTVWKLRVHHLLAKQKQLEWLVAARTRELREQATHDALTGLWNQRAILEIMNRELERAQRENSSVTIALIDLDHFKQVNDTWGHLVGDAVLREFGERFREAIRSYDAAGRYGGEEFLVILPHLSGDAVPLRAVELHSALTKLPIPTGEERITVTCSMGVVTLDGQQEGIQPWLKQEALSAADTALYHAKRNGRNRIEFSCQTIPLHR
jgi:diguanylate cyclase (GGDEF)-like protein